MPSEVMLDTFPFDQELESMCDVVSSDGERSDDLVSKTFARKQGHPSKVHAVYNVGYSLQDDGYDLPEQPMPVQAVLQDINYVETTPRRRRGRPRKTTNSSSTDPVCKQVKAMSDCSNLSGQHVLWMDVDSRNNKTLSHSPKLELREQALIQQESGRPRRMGRRWDESLTEVAEPQKGLQTNATPKGHLTLHSNLGNSAKYVVGNKLKCGFLRCKLCKFQTRRKYVLDWHVRTHHMQHSENLQILECASCDYKTRRKSYMANHVVKHLPENWLKCPKCDFVEPDAKTFYNHYLCHETFRKKGMFPCPFCSYKCQNRLHIARHVSCHRKNPKICDCGHCDFSTTRSDHLERHRSRYHWKADDDIENSEEFRRT